MNEVKKKNSGADLEVRHSNKNEKSDMMTSSMILPYVPDPYVKLTP